MITQTFTKHH